MEGPTREVRPNHYGSYLHLAYQEGPAGATLIRYARSLDLGANWGTPVTVWSSPYAQTEPSIAGCATCAVGILWTQRETPTQTEVNFSWSGDNGVTWNAPSDLSQSNDASQPALAADERRGSTDALYLRFHAAWNFGTGPTGYNVAHAYSDKADDSGTALSVPTVDPLLERRGTAAAVPSSGGDAYVFGGITSAGFSNQILRYLTIGAVLNTGDILLDAPYPSGKAWMPAVWWPGDATHLRRAYLFWGQYTDTPGPGYTSSCITIYIPDEVPANRVKCDASGVSFRRWGASAVYDGARYVYLFGGYYADSSAPSRDILRMDILSNPDHPGASIVNRGLLPQTSVHGAAVWDTASNLAWVIRGVPTPHLPPDALNRAIYRFDGTSAVQVATLPQIVDGMPAPAWKYAATYDATVQRVVIFGGSADCYDYVACPDPWVWYHDTIFRFDPATYAVVLDPCLRLPSPREGTSAVHRTVPTPARSIVFGGANGWDRYNPSYNYVGEAVHYFG